MEFGKFSYVVIPGKPFHTACPPELHQQLLTQWMSFWATEYSDYGSHAALNPMNFFRQDKYTAILSGGEIVATHGLTFFDLRFNFDQFEYFNEMHSPQALAHLRAEGHYRIVVQQYFMVSAEHSVRKVGINLSAVMAMLSLKHHRGFDGTLTAARTEVAAGSLALKLGYIKLSDSHLVHNVPVASYFCRDPKPYRRQLENDLVDFLWQTKMEFNNSWRNENEDQRDLGPAGQPIVPNSGEISL